MKFILTKAFTNPIFSRILATLLLMSVLTTLSFAQTRDGFGLKAKKDSSQTTLAPTPIFFPGSPTCATVNASTDPSFTQVRLDWGLAVTEPSGSVTYTNGPDRILTGGAVSNASNSASVTSQTGNVFDWTSTIGVTAVIVTAPGFTGGNVYPYPVPSFGDQGLTQPVPHFNVEYCHQAPANVTIIKEIQAFDGRTSATIAFPFTATNLGISNFSLVDNGQPGDRFIRSDIFSFGAANTITVSESQVLGWTLGDLTCVETATGGFPNLLNTTTTFATATANIVVEPGESVTCTFRNLQLGPSAAPASVSGRVMDPNGRGVSRARITVTNASSGVSSTVLTNPFGYYRIEDLGVSEVYLMTIRHKRYSFADDSRVFTLNEDLAGFDFVANP